MRAREKGRERRGRAPKSQKKGDSTLLSEEFIITSFALISPFSSSLLLKANKQRRRIEYSRNSHQREGHNERLKATCVKFEASWSG
jgi:hypothetical protein